MRKNTVDYGLKIVRLHTQIWFFTIVHFNFQIIIQMKKKNNSKKNNSI